MKHLLWALSGLVIFLALLFSLILPLAIGWPYHLLTKKCSAKNKACTKDDECCDKLKCKDKKCTDETPPAPKPCAAKDEDCKQDSDCCDELKCKDKKCTDKTPPAPPPCKAKDEQCKQDGDCCDELKCKDEKCTEETRDFKKGDKFYVGCGFAYADTGACENQCGSCESYPLNDDATIKSHDKLYMTWIGDYMNLALALTTAPDSSHSYQVVF